MTNPLFVSEQIHDGPRSCGEGTQHAEQWRSEKHNLPPSCLSSLILSSSIFLIINISLTYFKKLPFLVTWSYSINQNRCKQPEKGNKNIISWQKWKSSMHTNLSSEKTNNPKIKSKAKWPNLSDPRQLETRLRICDDVGMRRVGQVVGGWGWVSTGQLDIFRQASLNLEQISQVYWRRELWADHRQRPTIKIQNVVNRSGGFPFHWHSLQIFLSRIIVLNKFLSGSQTMSKYEIMQKFDCV